MKSTTKAPQSVPKPDPKASLDYYVKPIFNESKQLRGRDRELQILQSRFRRLMDDGEAIDAHQQLGDSDAENNAQDADRKVPPEFNSAADDDTSECSTELFKHSDSLQCDSLIKDSDNISSTDSKRQTKIKQPKPAPHLRHSIKQASDISIQYESTLLCQAPHTRECIFLYGPQGMGKRSLARHALENLAKERGGWFLTGEFERDYFGKGGGRSRRRSNSEGGNKRGVRFSDEKSDDDDALSTSSGIPLSGLIGVCKEICAKLLELRRAESAANTSASEKRSRRSSVTFNMSHLFHDTVEKFMQSLSMEERQLLVKSLGLPVLRPIFGMDNSEVYYEAKIDNVVHHKKKLQYAFQKFISVICQLHGPLVICFNNFQYAEEASLDLVESVLFDREIGKLMIVGCVQLSDQSDTTHKSLPLSDRMSRKIHAKIDQWKDKDNRLFGLNVTEVELNSLSLDSTQQIVMDMLSLDQDGTSTEQMLVNMLSRKDNITSLAELCYEYSHGNTYFLQRFMEILHKKKLLYMDNRSGKWTWELYDVTSMITSSSVVDVILGESANKLPKQAKSLLLLATCMGSTYIDEDMLFRIWSKFERKSRANVDVQSQFRLFINESLYRKVLVKIEHPFDATHRAYHWAHESMIKALSGHVDSTNIASLRYEIGSTLEYCMGEEADSLVVAKLINSGGNALLGSLDSKKRVKWAEKNLMAAKKAVLMSAFDAAAQYAEAGIEYMPSSRRWKEHCKLMLELSSILGEVAGALGNSRLMERWCEEIICRNELHTSDKIRAYMTLIANLAADDHRKAVSLCLSILKKLDCTFNRDAVTRDTEAFTSCIEETRVLKKEEFLAKIEELGRMDDREKIECIKLLCKQCQFYVRQSKPAFTMAISRAARWTYHYGLSADSPVMFAYLGLAYVMKQEFRVGAMNAEAAISLLSKTSNQAVKVKANYIIWYKVMPWSRHVRDSSRPLLAAYNFGLQSGDIESAMKCIFGKLTIDLISGRSLVLIEQTCRAVVPQMEHAGVFEIASLTRVLWQTVLNLIGDDDSVEDITVLNGKAFSETDFAQDPGATTGFGPYIKKYLDAFKSYLYLFIGEYAKGAELALERGNDFIETIPGSALGLTDLVSRGLPLIIESRTSKKKYAKSLNDVKQRSKAWSNKGVCSMIHLELLLAAEQAALEGNRDAASNSYKKGMTFASRSGFAQDVALINYRYASFLRSNNMSNKEAEYHLENARTSYEGWGYRSNIRVDGTDSAVIGSSLKSLNKIKHTIVKKVSA